MEQIYIYDYDRNKKRENVVIPDVIDDIPVTDIDHDVFYENQNVVTVEGRNIDYVGEGTFAKCYNLRQVSFPKLTYLDDGAFYDCYNIEFINESNIEYIGEWAFPSYCTFIMNKLSNSNYAFINGSKFLAACSNVTESYISFPECKQINEYVFEYNENIQNVNFPQCNYIRDDAFYGCSSLTNVSFPECSHIGTEAFYGCSKLMSVYLLSTSVCYLRESNAFFNTPMSNSTYTGSYGSIYVPESLVNQYKSAYNWSYYKDRIVGISTPTIS